VVHFGVDCNQQINWIKEPDMTTPFSTPFSTSPRSGDPWPVSWEPPHASERLDRPTPPAPPFAGAMTVPSQDLARWLDAQEEKLTHPKVVEDELRQMGWQPWHGAAEAARYRTRFNEHALGYTALLVATGVAALAAGTVGHVLVSGVDHTINRNVLAGWLTVLVVSLPFAIWAHIWAARVDRDDPVAVWSQPRKSLAKLLVWACGLVGIGRLLMYAAQLIGSLVGATWASGDSVLAGAVNVAITVSIALPLGLWAFRFLHRFDDEDPAAPRPRRRAARR
jgi:hypothetical protein